MNQLKQKNYRDFTIGELLDAGLKVDVRNHHSTKEENRLIAAKFEGTKRSSHKINVNLSAVTAQKKAFSFVGYVSKEGEANA